MINELLKGNHIKLTKQRKHILEIINLLGDSSTLKNIINTSSNKMNTSTIYRILDLLIQKKIIEKKINYNNETYFIIKEAHTHYINCIKCHKKEKIDICPLKNIEKNLKKEGYQIISHNIELEGICNSCQSKN